MTLHKSLKSGDSMIRHRSVLGRIERLEMLEKEKRWDEEKSILGLPKVRSVKRIVKKKAKKKKEEAAAIPGAPVEGAAPPAEAKETPPKGSA
ncbi:MAG: small basic protein [Planctomycetota bacterium]